MTSQLTFFLISLLIALINSTVAIDQSSELLDSLTVKTRQLFEQWNCSNNLDYYGPIFDCTLKDIEKIDTSLVFKNEIEIKFDFNRIEFLRETFYDPNGKVIKLDFSNNKLEYISTDCLVNLTVLQEIDLSHNQLWELDSDTFNSQVNLLSLDLSFNEFSILSSGLFKSLKNLKILSLQGNRLTILSEETFVHLLSLQELDLSGNDLSQLPDQLFSRNWALRSLNLAGNGFRNVPSDALASARKLYQLNLNSNKFIRIKYPAFAKLATVAILRLENQPDLRSIGPQAFQGMNNLAYFYCDNNYNLRFVDPLAFYDNITDSTLDLSSFFFRHNGVNSLSGQLLKWSLVDELDFTGNPWNCDCHLRWMVNLKINERFKNGIKCSSPSYLSGQPIANLSSDQLNCHYLFNHEFSIIGSILLIITISMTMVVFCYLIVKVVPCKARLRNPLSKNHGYTKVKVSKNGKNYDLEWDPALGDPN